MTSQIHVKINYPKIATIISQVGFSLCLRTNNSVLASIHLTDLSTCFYKRYKEFSKNVPFWWCKNFIRQSQGSVTDCRYIYAYQCMWLMDDLWLIVVKRWCLPVWLMDVMWLTECHVNDWMLRDRLHGAMWLIDVMWVIDSDHMTGGCHVTAEFHVTRYRDICD